MPERNELLRAARERVESPSSPGRPLTRKELADLVNKQVYRATAMVTAVDDNHVGKWERGVVRWPAAHYRAALRAVLDVATDIELGFAPSSTPEDVDRKTFLKTAFGAGAGLAVGRPNPSALAATDELAATVAGPIEHYRRMESTVSSQSLVPAVEAHLRLAREVVRDNLRTSTGFGMLSEAAGLAAWLAADRGDAAMARRRYSESVRYAESAGHPLLVSYMTASLGHYAVESGDPRQGLQLLQRAAKHFSSSAPASAHAWLASLQAVAHASLRDAASTRAALRAAERFAERQRGEPQWPWVFPFTSAKVARYQASALALLGDVNASQTAYASATPALANPKPRALAQVEQASVLCKAGRMDEGCHLALEALELGRRYGSERITASVRDLRATLPARTAAAAELDNALTVLYVEES